MVSAKQLLSAIEAALLARTPPPAAQRVELMHAIRLSLPSLKSLLSYPAPKASDRAQVQSKEVRLPDSPPISLDDQDVQIALKISEDLHLNEIECVRLLVSSNQEWGLLGRDPLDIYRLGVGLWYMERRDLLTSLYMLLRATVLDQGLEGLEADLVAEIQSYLEDLIASGLRKRIISLIKELKREDPTGVGGPNSESYILDSRGALVERKAVISRERLILGHCLVLSILVERASTEDVKDILFALRECALEYTGATDTMKHQIIYSLLFSIVIAFISDALSTAPDKVSVLSHDASFRHGFNEIVMATGNDPLVEGFVNCVRFAWVVHLMLVQDGNDVKEITTSTSSNDMKSIFSCLEVIFANNVFQFWLDKVLRSAAYQNDDEDMVYVYNAYLHKLMTCFLSHPLARDKVKETKEKAMAMLSPYRAAGTHNQMIESSALPQETSEIAIQPFVSLLEFVSEIYQKEPELLSGNDVIWTFVKFSGEDHTNSQTLVAFLKMLSSLACTPEGASKVFELLQGKIFRSIGWSTLFDCLSIYEEKFKQSFQTPGAVLPEFQEGDSKALVAYLSVLKKVVENGNPSERKNWFTDIEPLFKLLSYENVPPYLKGALRNAIATFVHVSPIMKETIWRFLEQYDLPVVVAPNAGYTGQTMETQVYDMRFELNEIEARGEQYPSTISFINLLNTLVSDEQDVSDRGHRFIGIFRFVYDHVFGPFPQRAYADPSEKWQLVIACLKHFQMMLSMYDVGEEDSDAIVDESQNSSGRQSYPIHMQLPVVEIMKDFMSGKTLFRNVMGIVLQGVNFLITERTNQIYGHLLEKAVLLCLEIVVLVMEKDSNVSDFWRPLYQPLDVILSQDNSQIVALLEYVRYDFLLQIQLCSIKILSILSSRMVGLSQLLLKSGTASTLIEDYAACLEMRSEECQIIEDSGTDPGVLIMQLLIDNISRPAPNITHLLLKFDIDGPVERTLLQPKFQYSCLKVILGILDKLLIPDVNALLHEFGFQLLYELCVDPLTSAPLMDLLCTKKYHFFVKHLSSIGVAPLPKRSSSQALRISSLHQRAWLLKLLAVELHSADILDRNHHEACQSILTELFGQRHAEYGIDLDGSNYPISKSKVLELLGVVQFESPDITLKSSQFVSSAKYSSLAEDILSSPTTSGRSVYYSSERGDRLIDLASLRDRLWQKFNLYDAQSSTFQGEAELSEIREAIQQLLRWGWKYNKNLEEQAAQLHMSTSWSQIVEIAASQRISFLENRSDILFKLLDATLNFSGAPDCSLKMAQILTQVGLTCMAKLRDERFVFSSDSSSDTVTCLDIIMSKQLSNGACRSILFKLIMAILRHESSEALRRRQYALLLSYFQYSQHILDSDVPATILQFLSENGQEDEELDLEKIDKDQAELAHANFSILRKEGQPILNLVIKDATQGSESIKTISLYVLDALVRVDHDKFFLSQLETRGFLRSCFTSISNFSCQDGGFSLDSMQRLCTLEAELSLLLRISQKYGRLGSQHLFSMGSLQHIASCRALHLPVKGNMRRLDNKFGKNSFDVDKLRMVIAPTLRFLFSITSLVDTSEFLEVKNKVVREIIEFIKGHQLLFDQILQEDLLDASELTMEIINLVVGILSKVWPYEESDKYGLVQGLFGMMSSLFSRDLDIFSSIQSVRSENLQKADVSISRLSFSLSSYLYFLVTKKSLRLQVSDGATASASQQPTLALLATFLGILASALEKAAEEKYLLLNKIKDINELSRREVDEIINLYVSQDYAPSSESIQKRRYIAMVGMCRIVGHRSQLIMLLLLLSQNLMNIILVHFQDSSNAHDYRHSQKAITYDTSLDDKEDMLLLCGELVSVLERLESLSEDKTGNSLEVFRRLARSLKEMSLQKQYLLDV
ncbi:nuclear pore complex protein NUP205-like isoform X1 [Salvia splendens]|uniref:nuclear pore complex protein NUP205-like isoform X1 n=1 Tax=Salvia splendens TaxID=180675 RepID=UPI001C26C212|nr:nuclear pore complex protein NUP205-like isoform X1 [Salvia splendens]